MKKIFMLVFLASILLLSFASATITECNSRTTIVGGTVYIEGSPSTVVEDAEVQVTCQNTTLTSSTDASGHYSVDFQGSECNYGDIVSVHAQKDDMTGSNEDYVNDAQFTFGCGCEVDVGIVNVPLIPEFGLLIGGLTIVSSLVAFMIIRRK